MVKSLLARGTIMAPPLRVMLDQAAKTELERRYQTTHDATTRTRYQMVLLRAEGHPVAGVAQLTRCSPDTVRRVLKRYLAGGPDAVPHRPHLGQPPHWPPAWEAELVRVAELDPHEVGVDSALWTCRLLADYLHGVTGHAAGIETVRVALHRPGLCASGPAGC
jgi:transposase